MTQCEDWTRRETLKEGVSREAGGGLDEEREKLLVCPPSGYKRAI